MFLKKCRFINLKTAFMHFTPTSQKVANSSAGRLVCPYCKGQSPTCLECDYGGYSSLDIYQGQHRKKTTSLTGGALVSSKLPSLRDQWLNEKLALDSRRLEQIFQQPFSLRDYQLVSSIWLFWKKQSDLPQSVRIGRQLTELLELVNRHIQTNRKPKSIS